PVTPISIYKIGDIETAFRLMQAGKHMGKIVIAAPEDAMVPVSDRFSVAGEMNEMLTCFVQAVTQPPKLQLHPDASYLIVGGLGGIGRSLCKNFVENGARSLVFLSRNANVSQQSGEFLNELRSTGCIVHVVDCDISNKTQVKSTMLRLKQNNLRLRRSIAPVREVTNGLMRRDQEYIPDDLRPYIQDVYSNTLRILESLDLSRDALSNLFEVRLSVTNNKLSEVVERMTAISTALVISTLIAGIYGMNFEHMPELKWLYGYPFALGLMIVLSGGTLLLFKRLRWF
ncbi:SDR family NAD(P)-dependent oxidoreductase, partial [bacterium]